MRLACVIALLLAVTGGCQSTARVFEGSVQDAKFVLRGDWELKDKDGQSDKAN